jgi:hypothetical protein
MVFLAISQMLNGQITIQAAPGGAPGKPRWVGRLRRVSTEVVYSRLGTCDDIVNNTWNSDDKYSFLYLNGSAVNDDLGGLDFSSRLSPTALPMCEPHD